MKTLRTPRRQLLTRALRASALFGAAPALRVQPIAAAAHPATPATAPTIVRPGAPLSLHIPAVSLAAPVEPVWLTAPAGGQDAPDHLTLDATPFEIGLPTDPFTAGWYALGAIPGEPGDALLVGHVDTATGPAVFTRLAQLRLGAELTLERTGAAPLTFVVDSVRRHAAHLPAPADLFRLDGPSRLHLITCTGSFVRARGGYLDRLVVSASPLLPSEPAPEEALQP